MARTQRGVAEKYNSPFAVALRALMSEKPITTQDKLAEVTKKTRQTVSQYVNGVSEPGYDTLVKIADHFDVSVDYLLGRTKDRRKTLSVYDQLGLSERNITVLRLAQEAKTNQDKMDELANYIYKFATRDLFFSQGKPMGESDREYYEKKAKMIASTLPTFVDNIIEIAMSTNLLLDSYMQITTTDHRAGSPSEILTPNDFIEYKIYQISNVINWELRRKFIEVEIF